MERLCVIAGLVLLSGVEVLMKGVGSGLFCVEERVSRSEGGRDKNGKWKDENAQQHSTPGNSETQSPDSQLDNLK